MARYAICNYSNRRNKDINFVTNKYGKPMLSNESELHFNISHSGSWVSCALHYSPIGIDIEQLLTIDIHFCKRFFTTEEYNALINESEKEREKYFYKLWTLKESYIKAEGKGLSIPLNSFNISIEKGGIYATANNDISNYKFKQFYLDESHVCAVCAENLNEFNRTNFIITSFMENLKKSNCM